MTRVLGCAKQGHAGDAEMRPAHLRKTQGIAWLPIACFSTPAPFVSQIGWYWLTPVTPRKTFSDGWRAYVDENSGVPLRSHWIIASAAVAGILVAFAAVAGMLWPIALKLPWRAF